MIKRFKFKTVEDLQKIQEKNPGLVVIGFDEPDKPDAEKEVILTDENVERELMLRKWKDLTLEQKVEFLAGLR